MNTVLIKIRTAFALGLPNLWRALSYRLGVKTGLNPVRKLVASLPCDGIFFHEDFTIKPELIASQNWQVNAVYFGWFSVDVTNVPNWHYSPFTQHEISNASRPWWQIPDFDPAVGDVKVLWEASRFDWVLTFAEQAKQGQASALIKLNQWLADWCHHNPAYLGVNWKCGQEASIRVMHLLFAAYLLEQTFKPCNSLITLIKAHIERIEPTLRYAMAQDNNHGTSEAAALFMAGEWLQRVQPTAESRRWSRLGRFWLENRVARLIEKDGSFSQYSVNYHRVMLDTLSMVEFWRLHLKLPLFSQVYLAKAQSATLWLHMFTSPIDGDVPNIGANDGARLLPLTQTDYRDYRPSVQLAAVLFHNTCAYSRQGSYDLPLQWLGILKPSACLPLASGKIFDDGGYAVLSVDNAVVYLRYPRFKFRPSQADALHLDFWLKGENVLCDAGSYSYNADERLQYYFPSTSAHNTIEFDDRNQMPRLSRFLLGNWLKTHHISTLDNTKDGLSFMASYYDCYKSYHQRTVQLKEGSLVVIDNILGFKNKAILRWRLPLDNWQIKGNCVSNSNNSLLISISSDVPIIRLILTEGWQSRYYLQKTPVVVLEVEVTQAAKLRTEFSWLS